jgi:ribosome biogenesis GTPase
VVTRFGAELVIEDETGLRRRCTSRRRLQDAVCGDRVEWSPSDSGNDVVTAILPRHNLLQRLDPRGQIRPVAANLDQVVVVIARRPPPQWPLVDRYLVAIEHLDARALLLVNKADLEPDPSDTQSGMEERYRQLGYPVVHTSASSGLGLDDLRGELKGRTSILVGQSGVGKSSLIQALLPGESLRIGEVSESTGEGRHTTTAASLYHLPGGGDLIDSPGVRDFTPPPLPAEELARGFVEFRSYLGQCRFHNCSHDREPGCAIKAAVESGEISSERYRSYLAMKK